MTGGVLNMPTCKLQTPQQHQQRCLSSASSTKLSSYLSAVSSATISAPAAKPTMLQIVSGPRACICFFARSSKPEGHSSSVEALRAPCSAADTGDLSGLGTRRDLDLDSSPPTIYCCCYAASVWRGSDNISVLLSPSGVYTLSLDV